MQNDEMQSQSTYEAAPAQAQEGMDQVQEPASTVGHDSLGSDFLPGEWDLEDDVSFPSAPIGSPEEIDEGDSPTDLNDRLEDLGSQTVDYPDEGDESDGNGVSDDIGKFADMLRDYYPQYPQGFNKESFENVQNTFEDLQDAYDRDDEEEIPEAMDDIQTFLNTFGEYDYEGYDEESFDDIEHSMENLLLGSGSYGDDVDPYGGDAPFLSDNDRDGIPGGVEESSGGLIGGALGGLFGIEDDGGFISDLGNAILDSAEDAPIEETGDTLLNPADIFDVFGGGYPAGETLEDAVGTVSDIFGDPFGTVDEAAGGVVEDIGDAIGDVFDW